MRTIREAHIMLLLRHPHIVGLKDLITVGPYFYVLMDYVNGGQLLHYIVKRQRLSEGRARLFSRQIVSALDYMHRNSIVHRDLKIENILIDKSGRNVKLIDFGLSNLFHPNNQLTTYCGSLYFAAPELLCASPYNGPEIDIWSLGVVIYVMITGSVPFDDKSMPGLHEKIKRGEVNYPAHMSDECRDFLSQIFITDPSRRILLTDVIRHPWMNVDQPAVKSFLPSRKPLELPLEDKVVDVMGQGFGFGETEDIKHQLEIVVQSDAYSHANKRIAHQQALVSKPHNSMTSSDHGFSVSKEVVYDDPQSIPEAYHPLVSIYHLTRERQQHLEQEHGVTLRNSGLSRKASIESGVSIGTSSTPSSQVSLELGESEPTEQGTSRPRRIHQIAFSQAPLNPIPPQDGSPAANGSVFGLTSQPSAAIGSVDYLARIQRWLRSSVSNEQFGHSTTHEEREESSQIPVPPIPVSIQQQYQQHISSQLQTKSQSQPPVPAPAPAPLSVHAQTQFSSHSPPQSPPQSQQQPSQEAVETRSSNVPTAPALAPPASRFDIQNSLSSMPIPTQEEEEALHSNGRTPVPGKSLLRKLSYALIRRGTSANASSRKEAIAKSRRGSVDLHDPTTRVDHETHRNAIPSAGMDSFSKEHYLSHPLPSFINEPPHPSSSVPVPVSTPVPMPVPVPMSTPVPVQLTEPTPTRTKSSPMAPHQPQSPPPNQPSPVLTKSTLKKSKSTKLPSGHHHQHSTSTPRSSGNLSSKLGAWLNRSTSFGKVPTKHYNAS
ncbi:kinase-like domain-containing protein [Spinellus fusiger]|nr:kinase-like domain-containing protein [Spinellus fusiger]